MIQTEEFIRTLHDHEDKKSHAHILVKSDAPENAGDLTALPPMDLERFTLHGSSLANIEMPDALI